MASKFEQLVNGMINVSFGAAAVAAEKGKDFLSDLNERGEKARREASSDFARSLSDAFDQASGAIDDTMDRISSQGESAAEKVLDDLILLRARGMEPDARAAYLRHVTEIVQNAESEPVKVEVESVETEGADAARDAAE